MQHRQKISVLVTALALALVSAASSHLTAEQKWPWPSERFDAKPQQRNVAGQFDYYALVMSWSPTYCASASNPDDTQCNRRDGRRFAFVLHGLWPQYERGYPNSCRTNRKPFVPEGTINSMLDIMPSRGLVIHEYRKHGTCSGLDVQSYFSLARRLFESVRIPQRFQNPFETLYVAPNDLVREIAQANPGLPPSAIAVDCDRGSTSRLREIRICFSRDGKPRSCGQNENQRKLCSSNRVFLPPVRSTAQGGQAGSFGGARPPPAPAAPLSRPKLIEGLRGI